MNNMVQPRRRSGHATTEPCNDPKAYLSAYLPVVTLCHRDKPFRLFEPSVMAGVELAAQVS